MNHHWKVIINPNAGGNKGSYIWQGILTELNNYCISYDYCLSEERGHIKKITIQAIKNNFRNIIIIGGDGSLNETINGIYEQDIVLPTEIVVAHIALGTGNDWQKTHLLPVESAKMIERIKQYNVAVQDVGVIHYQHEGVEKKHYFINVSGSGFDAFVVKNVENKKGKKAKSKYAYLWSLFQSLIKYSSQVATLRIDGKEEFSGKLFSICFGIGKYNGGGMMQLPNANPNDGIIDITLIAKVSKLKVLSNIKNLYDGSFICLKEVSLYKGKEIQFTANNRMWLESDGELIGKYDIHCTIIPKGFSFIH